MLGLGVSVAAVEGVARPVGETEELGLLEDAREGVEAVLALRVPLTVMRVVEVTVGLALTLGDAVGLALRRLEGEALGEREEDAVAEGEVLVEAEDTAEEEVHAVRVAVGKAVRHWVDVKLLLPVKDVEEVADAEAEVKTVPEALGEARAEGDTPRERLADGVVVADGDKEALLVKAPERETCEEEEGRDVEVVLGEAAVEPVGLRVKEVLPDASLVPVMLADADVDGVLPPLNEASSEAVAALLMDAHAVPLLTGVALALDCGEAVGKSDAVENSDMVKVVLGLWELEDTPVVLGRPLAL